MTVVAFVRQQDTTKILNNSTGALTFTEGTAGTAPVNGNYLLCCLANSKGSSISWAAPSTRWPSNPSAADAILFSGSTSSSVQETLFHRFALSDSGVADAFTRNATACNVVGAMHEFSGVDSSQPLDQADVVNASPFTSGVLSATTATAGTMAFYECEIFGTTPAVSAIPGFTIVANAPSTNGSNDVLLVTAYQAVASAGTVVTATPTTSGTITHITARLRILKATGTAAVPTANAGVDQSHVAGILVTLDGSASTDPGGGTLTYLWTHVSGPSTNAALSSRVLQKPTYTPLTSGTDVWSLVVTNPGGTPSSADTVSIAATNRAPVAVATPPGWQTTYAVGATVQINAGASYDPDLGDTITYAWTGVSGPNATGVTNTNASFTYTATFAGTDVWSLVVTDNHGTASPAATTTVTIGATGVRLRVNDVWVPALMKLRVGGAWVAV